MLEPVPDGDVKCAAADSPHILQHTAAGDHDECEQGQKEETPKTVENAVWKKDGVAASPALIEEISDAEPKDAALITPEKSGSGSLLPKEISDTESCGSVSSMSQGANEDEEHENKEEIAGKEGSNLGSFKSPPPSPTRSESLVKVSPTATPLVARIIHNVDGNLPSLEGKNIVSGSEPTTLDKGITNKVEESVSVLEEKRSVGEVRWNPESMQRELAEARAENARLRADLQNERSQKKLSGNGQDDPFAPREGKTLVWTDVNMTLPSIGKKPARKLLNNVWGEVPQGETTAIMGASGAGKSSLLNVLAGRVRNSAKLSVQADIRLNNYRVDPTDIQVRKLIAFVAQEDSLQVTATAREAIYFSAKLRLPRSTTERELETLTTRMLTELGLLDCADTKVGGHLKKGISGGERKRAAIAVELVVKPNLLFLDEPTSGLDSFSAVRLCQVLKKVANAGATVLFTIHQPSSSLFASFDRLILLHKGRVMYQGTVGGVSSYFSDCGYPSPPHYNPADWIMNVAQSVPVTDLDKAGFFPGDERGMSKAMVTGVDQDATGSPLVRRSAMTATPGLITQINMLCIREWRNLHRDRVALAARFLFTLFLSLLIGVIFLDVGSSDPAVNVNLNSHFGSLIMVLLMSMFGSAQPELLAFPEQRPVFLREYSTNHYSVVAYFMSRLSMEIFITALQNLLLAVITYFLIGFQADFAIYYATTYSLAMASTALGVMLGSAVENPKLGQEFLPVLFVPQMLFAGFFVAPNLIPFWLRWARFICTMTFALRIIMVAEFDRDCGSVRGNENCQDLLDNIDAVPEETWWNWVVLVSLFCFFRFTALAILQKKGSKFY